jgi:hypothetical protein
MPGVEDKNDQKYGTSYNEFSYMYIMLRCDVRVPLAAMGRYYGP